MKYIRIYGNIIFVAIITVLAIEIAPSFVTMVIDYIPSVGRSPAGNYVPLLSWLVKLVISFVGVGLIWILVRDRNRELHELPFQQTEGELEIYRGLTRDEGIEPTLARQVIQANSQMSEEDRLGDFHRAIRPNFAAELGYQLGVNSETRKMMQDFFAGADTDARRRFSTSTHITMEGGRIEQTHDTHADVEPISRYAPKEPENDPNWKGEVNPEELKAKIFGTWDEPLPSALPVEEKKSIPLDALTGERVTEWDIEQLGVEFVELDGVAEFDDEEITNVTELSNNDLGTWDISDTPSIFEHVEVDAQLEDEEIAPSPIEETVIEPITTPSFLEEVEEWGDSKEEDSDEEGEWHASEDEDDDEELIELPGYEEIKLQDEDELDEELDAASTEELAESVSDEDEVEVFEEVIPNLEVTSLKSDVAEPDFIGPEDSAVVFSDDDEIFAQVESDPVIAGLIKAIGLTRRLPQGDRLRCLFAFYGSEIETLVSEFHKASTTHIEKIGSRVEPLFRYAGVKRHQTTAWVLNLADVAVLEDDLNAIVWVPVGIAHLNDPKDHTAWKLMPVSSGSSATFYVLRSNASLVAARFEWIFGNLYEDLKIDQRDESIDFFLPSLGVTITLLLADELCHGDYDIHEDTDLVSGPTLPMIYDVSLLGDGGKKWFTERLGQTSIELATRLALLHMMTTLLVRVEPVTSRELLGQWATPESGQGKRLIEMLHTVFGNNLSGSAEGWELSNVRLDLFWLEEVLESADSDSSLEIVKDFFTHKFEPAILPWLLGLGAMEPRMRSGDATQLDRLIRKILADAVEVLGPSASGALSEKLKEINNELGKG